MIRSIRLVSSLTNPRRTLKFKSPYKPNTRFVPILPFSARLSIWLKSLQPGRLETLQKQLVELSFPANVEENKHIIRGFAKTPIDDEGNVISSITLEVINNSALDANRTKHIVFIHGYGASSGFFARNFQIINQLKGLKHNYKIHFLDNLSFGLSSNPSIVSINYWQPIPRVEHLKVHDTAPTEKSKLYKKYYKLIDHYEVDVEKFLDYKTRLTPVLSEMESYYVNALEAWKKRSNIDKIHFLVGHSFGGYWSGSFALRYPESVSNLVLLSPVGVERTALAVTASVPEKHEAISPSLDPCSYNFLSRWPILSKKTIDAWYTVQPYLPRLLKFMGPFGVAKYYDMWYSKLFALNKVIQRLGGEKVFTSENQLHYGKNSECLLLIEYLYNSITSGTKSDTHVKYLLTPCTTSKWPLMDKFSSATDETLSKFTTHVVYGQYDFMFSEAGEKMVADINARDDKISAKYHIVAEGGHNLNIQNPFGTNDLLERLVREVD